MQQEVLDHGFVHLIDHMGTDLTSVNAARVSFGKRKEEFDSNDEGLVKYLATHAHCYDEQTEVFTSRGWVYWKDVTSEDFLAAVHTDGTFTFEKPTRLIDSFYSGKMLRVRQSHISICVTPNHRMYVAKRKSNGFKPFAVAEAASLFGKQYRVKSTAVFEQGQGGTYADGWLYGFFLGDGCKASTNRIVFNLKKDRKRAALESVLTELKKSFTVSRKPSCAVTTYYVDDSSERFTGKSHTKRINEQAFSMSLDYRRGLLDGLKASDGCKKRAAYTYSSCNLSLCNDIQRLATTLGLYSKVFKKAENSYLVSIMSRSTKPCVNCDYDKIDEWIDYAGRVYCAEVSTGLLLVRREGCMLVCGNSAPFRHAYLTFHVKAPIFVFRQWMKHRVASDFNEISGRYVDLSQVDIFVPSTFRKPAKTNKQGSEGFIDPDNFVPAMQSYIAACKESVKQYNNLISLGVCKEQARCILPLGIYSEVYWTASLQAVAHFCALREDEHAQWEIRQYAIAVRDMVQALFPKTFPALLKAETLTLAALKDTEL